MSNSTFILYRNLFIQKLKWVIAERLNRIEKGKTIIFIGMLDSIHFERYIKSVSFSNQLEIYILPSSNYTIPTPFVLSLICDPKSGVKYIPRWRFFIDYLSLNHRSKFYVRILCKVFQNLLDYDLKSTSQFEFTFKFVNVLKPKIIHIFEMQNAGYLLLNSKIIENKNFKLFYTNYGSDLRWFKNFRIHLEKIAEVIKNIDLAFCESEQDRTLMIDLGYLNSFAPITLNSTISINYLDSFNFEKNYAKRKVIVVKGYNDFMGKADIIIESLFLIRHYLENYKIIFYSCSRLTHSKINDTLKLAGLDVESFSHGQLTNQELLDIFSRAVISLSSSKSDGVGTSNIESAYLGAYVITSNNSSIHEYLEKDCHCSNLDWFDVKSFADEILVALQKSNNLSELASKNRSKIRQIISLNHSFAHYYS
jgi:hypothetical protein